jgi:malate dehydrogenase (oxaloacetate-decarboxylating)
MSDTNVAAREYHGASNSLILRVHLDDRKGLFNQLMTTISQLNATVGSVGGARFVEVQPEGAGPDARPVRKAERDLTVFLASASDGPKLIAALNAIDGVQVTKDSDPTFLAHLGGKIEVVPKRPIKNAEDLARQYTPGVARICMHLVDHPDDAHNLTRMGNTILIVTDGSRVLGLGNIGPIAAAPVMEGKAALFKTWGDVNAVVLTLDTQKVEEIIFVAKMASKGYGGINLEDIASPGCWEIEKRLQEELDIPVFHDDQHGTAIAVVAATLNAMKVVKKQLRNARIVVSGVGAAGLASAKLLKAAGARHFIAFKKEGALFPGRADMHAEEAALIEGTRSWMKVDEKTTLQDALKKADMFLGLSAANLIKPEDLKPMRRDAIVFALANPVAEVDPEGARQHARIVATGSAEYENAINNAVVFPGFFRGMLDARVRDITPELKLTAARALAAVIAPENLRDYNIIPDQWDPKAHEAVANAVRCFAHSCGVSRRSRKKV